MYGLSNLLRLCVAIGFAAVLAACQTVGGSSLVQSTATAQLTPQAAASLAEDMVGRFAEQIGPGSTTIALEPDGSTFGQALEVSLRDWGYAVVTDQAIDATMVVALAYVVDEIDGSILVRLSTHTHDLTRMYRLDGEEAAPISPLSIMQRGAGDTA